MSVFSDVAPNVVLSPTLAGEAGLREAQLGALAAVAAHSTSSIDPGQIVLPTGVGKTEVATLAPFVLGVNRVLIVVPSKLVRGQVISTLGNPKRAKDSGVIPFGAPAPLIQMVEHRATAEYWEGCRKFDVVVGTPQVLSPGHKGVTQMPTDLFDLVIFDEAHHLPASTWSALLDATSAPALLLTATPFRNDGKRLPGSMIYTYPLARAVEQGVFGSVQYRPVDEAEGKHLDDALASAAVERLRSDEHALANSKLLVRSDSVEHARELVVIYEKLGVQLGLIVHDTPWGRAETMRRDVESGKLSGFVCIGALTEGFDFPALKIGAYHVAHKTLGPTIQFIGRLSRVGEIGGELLASRAAVTTETTSLYREDVGWEKLLPELVDSAIDHERDVRTFVDDSTISGPLELSPLSLTPSRSVNVFRSPNGPDTTQELADIAGSEVVQRIEHSESNTLAFVTRRIARPRFMRMDTLDVPIYELHLVTWVAIHEVLFISTTSEPARTDILKALGPADLRPLSGEELRRILDAAKLDRFFSIGKRSARAGSGTSYETQAGPRTEDDITPADARRWNLGHGMGRSGDGTFGFSVAKSKVWQPGGADSLFEFRAWCEMQAEEINRAPENRQRSSIDWLQIPEPISEFPEGALLAVWPTDIFGRGGLVTREGETFVPERVEFLPQDGVDQPDMIAMHVAIDGTIESSVAFHTDGSVTQEGPGDLDVFFPDEEELIPLGPYLSHEPPVVYFADGSSTEGDRMAKPTDATGPVDHSILSVRAWDQTAITIEFAQPPAGQRNVAAATIEAFSTRATFIVQDHLPGEIADFIVVDTGALRTRATLVHCKSSGSATPAARVTDFQELAAQAIRSVQWCLQGGTLWSEVRRRLDERDATFVVKGEEVEVKALLEEWSDMPPLIEWEVCLVQPGLSDGAIDQAPRVASLLNQVHSCIIRESVALQVLCSA